MEEVWKSIDGYDGRYEISNFGRFKSYAQDKTVGKIKYGSPQKKGYLAVSLQNNEGHKVTKKIHRLVAEAFIPNPDNLPQVNHKDEDKKNNHVNNLEWCDNTYNHNYGTRNNRAGLKNRCHPLTSKRIYSIDKDGNVEHFGSILEAKRIYGFSHGNIIRALKGRCNTANGREWYYENPQITNND